jgi:hypothetical protein
MAVFEANIGAQSKLLRVGLRFGQNGLCGTLFGFLHLQMPFGSSFGTWPGRVWNLLSAASWPSIEHMHQQQLWSLDHERNELLHQRWSAS